MAEQNVLKKEQKPELYIKQIGKSTPTTTNIFIPI
jgi:hypothetical protein